MSKRPFELRVTNSHAFNVWQAERHYLKRQIIKSKLVAHGFYVGNQLFGGALWAHPHFPNIAGLFGKGESVDRWQVLMLARFYLVPDSGIIASQALSASVKQIQADWCAKYKPVNIDMPFVPVLLISWSDLQEGHVGTIYSASNWEKWNVTKRNGSRSTGKMDNTGEKQCWILRLPFSKRLHEKTLKQTAVQGGLL